MSNDKLIYLSKGQDCVQIYDYGKWDDADCGVKIPSVCEGPAVCGNTHLKSRGIIIIPFISNISSFIQYNSLLYMLQDNRFTGRCKGGFAIDDAMQCCHDSPCGEGAGRVRK